MQAYILIQTEADRAPSLAREIGGAGGVASAEVVTGPYDVIAFADAASAKDLGASVLPRIQAMDGVRRTLACPIA